MRVGKGAQNYRVHQAEDGGVRADSESQRRHRGRRDAGGFSQHPQRMDDILEHGHSLACGGDEGNRNRRDTVAIAGMEIAAIHHVSLTVTDLERSRRFYSEILSLREITRPPFNFPGAWF